MPTNEDRAAFARLAVDAYYLRTRHEVGPEEDVEAWEEVASDLLCDLHHLADRHGVDWDAVVRRASGHYEAEIIEEAGIEVGDSLPDLIERAKARVAEDMLRRQRREVPR